MAAARSMLSIVEAESFDDLLKVRSLFQEYAASLGFDLDFQDFHTELATLPGSYLRPDGRLLLATEGTEIAGCVALRPLEPEVCEMKRLYVRPQFRHLGVGRLLAERVVAEGRMTPGALFLELELTRSTRDS
jgi:putative acetyltransferase